jgi:hypothetical protein
VKAPAPSFSLNAIGLDVFTTRVGLVMRLIACQHSPENRPRSRLIDTDGVVLAFIFYVFRLSHRFSEPILYLFSSSYFHPMIGNFNSLSCDYVSRLAKNI